MSLTYKNKRNLQFSVINDAKKTLYDIVFQLELDKTFFYNLAFKCIIY